MCSFNYLFCKFTQWFLVSLNEIFQMRENYMALVRDGYPSSLDLEKNCFVHWPQANVFIWSWESRWLTTQVFILEVMTKQIIKKYDVKYMTHVFHYLGGKLTVAADKFDLHIILCTRGNTYKVLKQTGRLRASVYTDLHVFLEIFYWILSYKTCIHQF